MKKVQKAAGYPMNTNALKRAIPITVYCKLGLSHPAPYLLVPVPDDTALL